MNVILLSGGSGTRLWPLSNDVRSKQFLKILRAPNGKHESMVQRVYRMISEVDPDAAVTIATSENQEGFIRSQLGEAVSLSCEPCRRDTFPAIALAAAYLHDILGVKENESVVVCPVDSYVEKGYFETLRIMAEKTDSNNLTLMGITPTYPSEKYGYIIPDDRGFVKEFKEKPDAQTAQRYIEEGALWNSGVFAFSMRYILSKTTELCGTDSYQQILENYDKLDRISFDYAVAEHEDSIGVIEYHGEWKDLGTWNTFTEAMDTAACGNVIMGEENESCENVNIVNELNIPMIALGLKDLVIAATPDGILVTDKGASSYLKKYVPDQRPMYEKREWGEYRVIDYDVNPGGDNCLTKYLTVLPQKHISYQRHRYRSEVWTIVSGEGVMILNDDVKRVKRGDTAYIAHDMMHGIKAITELKLVEVQIGDVLIEEDIERCDYDWDGI